METRTEKIPFEPETGHAGAGKSCLFIMAKAYTLYGAPKVFYLLDMRESIIHDLELFRD